MLQRLGFCGDVARRLLSSDTTLVPARVVRQERGRLDALTSSGVVPARAAGRLLHEGTVPVIGDWVLVSTTTPAIIHAVAERTSLLARRAAGGNGVQAIAANVDRALVVQPMDRAPNLRRIERTMALVRGAGVRPIVVLTKADLAPDPEEAARAVAAIAADVVVIGFGSLRPRGVGSAAREGSEMTELMAHLPERETAVLLGPSGAGKSTLANRLVGEARLSVAAVRHGDAKGRHTTTHRELVVLPGGGLLIDGPGMRELGLWADDDGVEATFDDVKALAQECRFRDCRHAGEPGCAVQSAVERGDLDASRVASFEKLARESAYEARRTDAALQQEHERKWRSIARAGRAAARLKGR